MVRLPRFDLPGGLFHVTTSGAGPCSIFADGSDCESFLLTVATTVRREGWTVLSYCLMTTHYHLLLETEHERLARGMLRLNGLYARTFNGRHRRRGHLFGDRYHAELVQTDGHLLETVRYIALNPVRAGICARPEDWRWSSYAATLGLVPPLPFSLPGRVLALFDGDPDRARARLKRFVAEGVRVGPRLAP